MAVCRCVLLLMWAGQILGETTNLTDDLLGVQTIGRVNEKNTRGPSHRVKPTLIVQSMATEESRNRNSSLHDVSPSKNFQKFPNESFTGWIPSIPKEKITQIIFMPEALQAKRNFNVSRKRTPRRRKLKRVRAPNSKKNVSHYQRQPSRKPKLFSIHSPRTAYPHRSKENAANRDEKLYYRKNDSEMLQISPNRDVLRRSFIKELKSVPGSVLPVHTLFMPNDVEEKKSELSDTFDPKINLHTAPFRSRNVDFQHYNVSNGNPFIREESNSYSSNMKHAFEDFNNNIMTMYPIERRGETSEDTLVFSDGPNFDNQTESVPQREDLPAAHSDSYSHAFDEDGQSFLTSWHEKFGSSTAHSPQIINTIPETYSNDNEQLLSLGSAENQFLSHEMIGESQEKLSPEPEEKQFSSLEHSIPSSAFVTALPNNHDDAPNIVYQYSQPLEISYDEERNSMPSSVEDMIYHMKNVIHGNRKYSMEEMEDSNISEISEMLGAVNDRLHKAVNGLYFDSRAFEEISPVSAIFSEADAYDNGDTYDHVDELNERIKNKKSSLGWRVKKNPHHSSYDSKFDKNRYRQRPITMSEQSQGLIYDNFRNNVFSESEQFDVMKEQNQDTNWGTIFSTHFLSPDAPKRSTFRTSFKKLNHPYDTPDHHLEMDEQASVASSPALRAMQNSSDVALSEYIKFPKFQSKKNASNLPKFNEFDNSPWRPAYPLIVNKMKSEVKPTKTAKHSTADLTTSNFNSPIPLYAPQFDEEETMKPKLRLKNNLKGKNPAPANYGENNFVSSMSTKLNQLLKPSKKRVTGKSWPTMLYDYISTSFFGKDDSKAKPHSPQSSSDGYDKTTESKRQKWPRTEVSTSTDAPVVGSKEYFTVTAVAALGTLTSMVLFSLNNPFGGRDDSNTKQHPDPLVEQTLKFLAEAAAEYKNFAAENSGKSGPVPMTTSEFKYPDHRINEEHVNEMLSAINAKHTVNIKNNLALFVSNAYRLLKKYPSDTGIIKLVNSALQFYKKLNAAWKTNKYLGGSNEGSYENSEWQPLSEKDFNNMIYLMHEMNEVQKFMQENESFPNVSHRQNATHSAFKFLNLNASTGVNSFPIFENSSIVSASSNYITQEAFPNLQLPSFTGLFHNTTDRQQTSRKTPKPFSGEQYENAADDRSRREYRSENGDEVVAIGLPVSPHSKADVFKLVGESEQRRKVIINNVLQDYDRIYPESPLETTSHIIRPQNDEKPNPPEGVALRGIFINNELHTPAEQLLQTTQSR